MDKTAIVIELNAKFHILSIKNMLKNSPNFLLIVINFLKEGDIVKIASMRPKVKIKDGVYRNS